MYLLRVCSSTSMWNILSSYLTVYCKSFSSLVQYLSIDTISSVIFFHIVIQKVSLICQLISILVLSDKQTSVFLISFIWTVLSLVSLMLEMATGGIGSMFTNINMHIWQHFKHSKYIFTAFLFQAD